MAVKHQEVFKQDMHDFVRIARQLSLGPIECSQLCARCAQSASLVLTTTPAEEVAAGLRAWLAPARALRAPVDEAALTLLLSLRFMSLVFDEVRNLALGLAARGVPWRELPPGGGVQVAFCPPCYAACVSALLQFRGTLHGLSDLSAHQHPRRLLQHCAADTFVGQVLSCAHHWPQLVALVRR